MFGFLAGWLADLFGGRLGVLSLVARLGGWFEGCWVEGDSEEGSWSVCWRAGQWVVLLLG